MILPYCVYILFSLKDKNLYIGFSTRVAGRLNEHNAGRVRSTKTRLPLELIFCELYLSEKDARRREQYFKTTAGKKAIRFMLKDTLEKSGYKPVGIIYESV
jgi:putative endonuclease